MNTRNLMIAGILIIIFLIGFNLGLIPNCTYYQSRCENECNKFICEKYPAECEINQTPVYFGTEVYYDNQS